MAETEVYIGGGPIFDGNILQQNKIAHFSNGHLVQLCTLDQVPPRQDYIDLHGDVLSPGYVDLQVNGGDGIMLNAHTTLADLERIVAAHRRLGSVQILPTLITDTPETTTQVIATVTKAIEKGQPGIAGLHLEGPHLAKARKGAHDGALIRRMTNRDLGELLAAAPSLPLLKVTLAPESVTPDQVKALVEAGVLVSMGHTDCTYEQALTYAAAGATCVTHLFNAMSQLNNRAPGLVGAALTCSCLNAGIIADGIHVHLANLKTAWSAKSEQDEGKIFLVSDAMAPAGTDIEEFALGGRQILRQDGRLTLRDGTLAGADLDLTTAVRILKESCDLPLEAALTAAVTTPRQVLGQWGKPPVLTDMDIRDFIRIRTNLSAAQPLVDL